MSGLPMERAPGELSTGGEQPTPTQCSWVLAVRWHSYCRGVGGWSQAEAGMYTSAQLVHNTDIVRQGRNSFNPTA